MLNDFHNKYKEAPIEHSYLVDTKTGQIHDHSIGENRSVRPNWDAIPKGRQAIVIHNPHTRPQGILVTYDPLSNTDIKQLLSKPNVPYMIATNQHRTQIAKYYGAMPDIDS